MHALDAAKAAARAELLHARLRARAAGRRCAAGAVAALFGLAAFVLLHLAAYNALQDRLGSIWTPLAVSGGDVVLALLAYAIVGGGGRAARQAREAAALRDVAVAQLGRSLTLAATLTPLLRLLTRRR